MRFSAPSIRFLREKVNNQEFQSIPAIDRDPPMTPFLLYYIKLQPRCSGTGIPQKGHRHAHAGSPAGVYNNFQLYPSYIYKRKNISLLSTIEGRNAGLEQAIRNARKIIFDFIRRRVRTREDAEDILQDVFYQLVTSYSVTEPIENLTSWLYTVARNKVIDWYRKRKPRLSIHQGPSEGDYSMTGPLYLENILFDPEDNPENVYEASVVWRELSDALDDLPPQQREVFVMHELEGRSFNEIAEITGEPINTLLSRKRYAILALREHLQELYNEMQNH